MNKPSIILRNAHLHYASTAFKERSLKSALGKLLTNGKQPSKSVEDIHALKDISVAIEAGERVALIGHNGAGKSTFLRTVAGLYPISSGTIEVRGEVRSLFDLSLGFEPDATGRENIKYRGLLLGLTPSVMRQKESEIVSFASLGEFIDYPIKTYSAGMLVRLAFSISTAVGGDILLLDEVIGAGDLSFMERAARRIEQLIDQAEILILATHDLATLKRLCTRAIVFDHGVVAFDGGINEAVSAYQRSCNK